MTELQSPSRVIPKLYAHSERVSATGGTEKTSILLRFRKLFARCFASTDSRLSGVEARLSPRNTEVALGGSDMKRDVYGGWASAPASVLAPIVRGLGTHQHCTCCLVCRQWLHLLRGDVQHLWVKPQRTAAQTSQLLCCYSNLSSLNLSNSTHLQTAVPGLAAFPHIRDLRVSINSPADLDVLTRLPHLLKLSVHCDYSRGTEPVYIQLERLADLRVFRLHGARSVLGSPVTNPNLQTLELSQCPARECLTACTWLTKLTIWSPPANSLVSLVSLESLQFSVGGTGQDGVALAFSTNFFSPFTALTALRLEGLPDDALFEAVSQAAGLTELVVFRSPQFKAERTCQKGSLQHLCKLQRLQKLRCKFLCVEPHPRDTNGADDEPAENRMLYAASLAEPSDCVSGQDVVSEAGYQTKVKITQVGWWKA